MSSEDQNPSIPSRRLRRAVNSELRSFLLLEQGVDIRVGQEILGHSPLAVTKRYTHTASKLAEDAAAKMGKALWAYLLWQRQLQPLLQPSRVFLQPG